jgi:hypothetical protein
MAVWRVKEKIVDSAWTAEKRVSADCFVQLCSLAQHLASYEVTINSLVMKGTYIEIDVTGEIPEKEIDHLNIELVV